MTAERESSARHRAHSTARRHEDNLATAVARHGAPGTITKRLLPSGRWFATISLAKRVAVVVALALGPAVANSFARFAYALLLPAMRSDLGLSYAEAGLLNTVNALGYLAGALLAGRYASRFGHRHLFSAGLVVTALALIGAGLASPFAAQLALRAIAGVSGAMVFICGTVLASNALPEEAGRPAIGIPIYFAGAGVGILVSGVGIPWILASGGAAAWRVAWLGIGVVSLAFGALAIRAAYQIDEPVPATGGTAVPLSSLRAALTSYFLFGAGYIGYMTFVVAWMMSRGASPLEVGMTWGTLGGATLVAPLLWRLPRQRWPAATMLAATAAVMAIAAAIPLGTTRLPAMLLSAFLFGAAMFTAPTAVVDLVRTTLPKRAWGSSVALFTVVFAIGQSVGPFVTGWLADATHSLQAGLAASVVVLLATSVVALAQTSVRRMPIGAPATSLSR